MATYFATEPAVISLSATAQSATFSGGVNELYISADTDCYISFDETVPVVGGAALFIKANQVPFRFVCDNGSIQKVWGIGTSGKVYLMGVR